MSTNPTNAPKTIFSNCIVNMNTPACSSCSSIQPLPPCAKPIKCHFCKATILELRDHDPHSNPPPKHSPKKAVICSISYQRSSYKLKESFNFATGKNVANSMKDLLIKHFHFPASDIVLLTEEETDPDKTPTKNNLLCALYRLGQGCQAGDSLVFYYCGHGLPLRNYKPGEVDGYNETLCPMDFETEGMIFDYEINAVIVEHLPRGVKLHAIIDSCNRDSVLDLRFLYRKEKDSEQYQWKDSSPGSDRAFKGTNGGKAISFSSSVDVPPSADTPLLSETTSAGSMTRGFIHAIEHLRKQEDGRKLTYWGILDYMQNKYIPINATSADLKQEPLLSACGEFDVNTPFTL